MRAAGATYLCGDSLGPLPAGARDRVAGAVSAMQARPRREVVLSGSAEVAAAADLVVEVVATRAYDDPAYQVRAKVT